MWYGGEQLHSLEKPRLLRRHRLQTFHTVSARLHGLAGRTAEIIAVWWEMTSENVIFCRCMSKIDV